MMNSAIFQKWARKVLVAPACLVLLIATACVGALDNQVTLSWDEDWAANVRITVSENELMLASGEEALDRQIEQAFQEQQSTANTLGIRLSQSKQPGPDGSRIYMFNAQGQGFNTLNRFIFQDAAHIQKTTSPDESRIEFSYSPMVSGARFYSLTLSIRGGKVVTSNADRINGNSLAWADLIQTGFAQAEIVQPVAHPAVDHRLTMFQDERWKVETRLIVAADEYAAIGDEAVVAGQVRQAQQPMLDRAGALNLSVQEGRERGGDGAAIYTFTERGQGLNSLNRYAFQGAAQIEAVAGPDEPYIHFEYTLAGQGAYGYSLHLRGSRIITANADEVKDGVAIWRDLAEGSTAQADITVVGVIPGIADHVTFLGNERWEAETWWIVAAEDYTAIGDEGEVDRLVQPLQQPLLDRAQRSGVPVEQRKERGADGSAVYIVAVQGQDLDALNQIIFQATAQIEKVTDQNQTHIHFEYSPGSRASAGYSLRLRGDKVILSNADEAQEGFVIWSNLAEADIAQAHITEPGGVSGLVIGLLAGLLVVVAVGGFVLIRRWRRVQ